MASSPQAASHTAAQLRGALLTKINGQAPAAPVEAGQYGSLAEVKATKNSMTGVKVKPSSCAQTTVTGFNSPAFAGVPATVSTFKVGSNGVSEVLLAPSSAIAALALKSQIPASCARYTATVKGKTFVYTVSERTVSHLAQQARAMNIEATGSESVNVWSVVYRASDFVGAVTIAGPNATATVATTLAAQAYAHAAKTLH
ncbi:MAG TPA: hypothetical protein VHW06_12655 [Streptosporangiaceae bacterium]|nr:hypothetical protein [Streptosporangiaceae bacterium]